MAAVAELVAALAGLGPGLGVVVGFPGAGEGEFGKFLNNRSPNIFHSSTDTRNSKEGASLEQKASP